MMHGGPQGGPPPRGMRPHMPHGGPPQNAGPRPGGHPNQIPPDVKIIELWVETLSGENFQLFHARISSGMCE